MINHVTNLVYNNKDSLISEKTQSEIHKADVVLVYDSRTTQDILKKYQELTKGIISPSSVESTHSSEFLNFFYKIKKIVIPFNPPIDQICHNPYRNLLKTNLEQEQKITSEFLTNQPYQALNTSNFSISMYNQSFTYLFNYLENFLEEIPQLLLQTNQNIAYTAKKILIISNPNLLEFKFMKPNLIDQTLLTENYFNLSIRHEIFRRKVLNLEIPESLIYGYIIECCLKNLAQEKKLTYCRSCQYPHRKTMTSLEFEEFLELSELTSQNNTPDQLTSTISDYLDKLAKIKEAEYN